MEARNGNENHIFISAYKHTNGHTRYDQKVLGPIYERMLDKTESIVLIFKMMLNIHNFLDIHKILIVK
jgi:hypothetical protein